MASSSALRAVPVEQLAAPLSAAPLTSGRALPLVDPLSTLFPDGGLVRGKAVSCGGVAAMSLALSLAVAATTAGSWLGVVAVPTLGLEAAEEFGIPLERVVTVDPPPAPANVGESWAELVAATFDGFEVVITKVPQRLNAVLARRVLSRLQAREGVLITLGSPGSLSVDVELRAEDPRWEGVTAGSGYLRGRRVAVTSSGRRVQRQRQVSLWLPDGQGTVALADPVAQVAHQHVG